MDPRADRRYFPIDEDRYDSAFDTTDDDLFMPGDRIGAPLPQARSSMLSASIAIVFMAACAWSIMVTRSLWQPLLPEANVQTVASNVAPTVANQQLPPALVDSKDVSAAPGHDAGTPAPAVAAEKATAADTDDAELKVVNATKTESDDEGAAEKASVAAEPLPPPTIDPKDPLQKRALAAGLHPDLSRALLSRLSKADFRNASTAISKALAENGDNDVVIWPKEAPKKGAQFEVRLVAAAAESCRRYVVTVIRDRWSTTARPMEKCGDDLPQRRANARMSG